MKCTRSTNNALDRREEAVLTVSEMTNPVDSFAGKLDRRIFKDLFQLSLIYDFMILSRQCQKVNGSAVSVSQ